jgi:hypothetical protein
MDAVYVLGRGSGWGDRELLYSLRALHTYVTGIDRVVVVGHRPAWLRGILHLPKGDPHSYKERNIYEKLLLACRDARLSRHILFLNDDHVPGGPTAAADVPPYRGRELLELARALKSGTYKLALENTHRRLAERGHTTWNFDVHTPIVIDREAFVAAMTSYDWSERFVMKSLYANTVGLVGVPYADLKIFRGHTMAELVRILRGRAWWSHGPTGLGPQLKALLAALYPHPSPWENT